MALGYTTAGDASVIPRGLALHGLSQSGVSASSSLYKDLNIPYIKRIFACLKGGLPLTHSY
ncbi:hypothetical protein E2C01_064146 [Portunus trituberculatus]|uniref:Uncharacterized protein n=1 Tax=Portunus trituberculatus TaxID=210409 RepID=A0A5B7HIA3_PORTR|nr:hypothetical protein [Portunus trituberculatus]